MLGEQIPNQEDILASPVAPQNGTSGKNTGSVIGIVIIVIVLAFGGFYFWGKRLSEETSVSDETPFEEGENSLVPAPDSSVPEMIVGEEGNLESE